MSKLIVIKRAQYDAMPEKLRHAFDVLFAKDTKLEALLGVEFQLEAPPTQPAPEPAPVPQPDPTPAPAPHGDYTSRLSYGMVNFVPALTDAEMADYVRAAATNRIRLRVEYLAGKALSMHGKLAELRQRMSVFFALTKQYRVPVDIYGANGNGESIKGKSLDWYTTGIGQQILELADPTKDRVLPVNEPATNAQMQFHVWLADEWTKRGGKVIGYGAATHRASIIEFHPQSTTRIEKGKLHVSDNHPILAALGSDGEDQNFDLPKSNKWARAVLDADPDNEAGFYGWHHRKPDYPLMAMLGTLASPSSSPSDDAPPASNPQGGGASLIKSMSRHSARTAGITFTGPIPAKFGNPNGSGNKPMLKCNGKKFEYYGGGALKTLDNLYKHEYWQRIKRGDPVTFQISSHDGKTDDAPFHTTWVWDSTPDTRP